MNEPLLYCPKCRVKLSWLRKFKTLYQCPKCRFLWWNKCFDFLPADAEQMALVKKGRAKKC